MIKKDPRLVSRQRLEIKAHSSYNAHIPLLNTLVDDKDNLFRICVFEIVDGEILPLIHNSQCFYVVSL